MKTTRLTAAILASLLPLPALAHIHIAPEQARRGEAVELALVVGHGCAGAATTALRVAIPAGLSAEPLAQPGWQPVIGNGEVGWQGGPLPDHDKARLILRATIADDAPESIALPVVQVCGDKQVRWIEPGAQSESPAPVLQVLPAQ
ncbi:DUF1775 domain-containing protein [Paracoccus sp. PAR01]|uniref:DUF1775 domain-containing protein n=1 Tax=Paracoccus sp. PAR01 TaxID=2769282 RepID=UPI0017816DF3|nr:DUF1775 domain-containing protein [Paracoccus sp. PAR01]MBD9528678.1 DUF1775 domain-containing protein [Paracoccus sp. PAR01]